MVGYPSTAIPQAGFSSCCRRKMWRRLRMETAREAWDSSTERLETRSALSGTVSVSGLHKPKLNKSPQGFKTLPRGAIQP